ncbi:MAG TPA: WD40 repeat domain-containing serine/threonine-protein kinase [Thermoanaerobaculia bacterium]|nr:WD40 repeat domain-containing serine/threonine-protein kinase [Thermoanaerobaculia bacterium]
MELEAAGCPDCGATAWDGGALGGLCPRCLIHLGLAASALAGDDPAGDDPDAATLAAPLPGEPEEELVRGEVLAGRYAVRTLLGRGGMGEVWRAFDVKLRVEVALKAMRSDLLAEPGALELLRHEVRAAREVTAPNVCRVFDLVEVEGRELVSMEHVDGRALIDVIESRGPLELAEAREVASQLLAGLEAIHRAGLVHRDLKPENVMITRTGRVVVMDFGIAKGLADPAHGVSGTPAYMAPEQARGEPVDARADVFAAGVVLAEMLALGPERDRRALWEGIREDPPRLPSGPWAPILRQAVAPVPEDRYPSARALARALEEVALRVEGAEQLRPYPGLAAFTEADAERFFGRELEVEEVWKRLRRLHLLALIGPSGTGKSSFLRAGLVPALPAGWGHLVCTPGDRPFRALGQALAQRREVGAATSGRPPPGDDDDALVAAVAGWRAAHDETLVVVDQFEELFTLNPPETQAAFARLLGRLALEADARVLLSLRDDFLFHCHRHQELAPIFSELVPLRPLAGSALRRALVQPALVCGYRFDDDALVDEMLEEVSEERGALPLLAFAASRLWERRDSQRGLLTREAYEEIGGVAGALAQHAEASLERIGFDRLAVARELFRNLVTAEGTRAARDRAELLSVFAAEQLRTAEEVLGALIDARLLVSYETPPAEGETAPRHRVEIIHESLLAAWPRLVRWRTQDAEGAQLRDQLRQVARLWEERGRPADLLWAGTSFREFELWRERYPGRLSVGEERYARAMVEQAGRRRRRRRLALAAVLAGLLGVAAVMSGLWLRSQRAERQAVREARRAEGQQLFAQGQLELEGNPSAAIAWALASLERADDPRVRRFVMRALWRGPTAHVLGSNAEFPAGGPPPQFSRSGDALVQWSSDGRLRWWSADGGGPREIAAPAVLRGATSRFALRSDEVVAVVPGTPADDSFQLYSWLPERGPPRRLGTFVAPGALGGLDDTAERLVYAQGRDLYAVPVDRLEGAAARRIFQADGVITAFRLDARGERLAVVVDRGSEVRLWSRATGALLRTIVGPPGSDLGRIALEPTGRWLALFDKTSRQPAALLWSLEGPQSADPIVLRRGAVSQVQAAEFDPGGRWLAIDDKDALSLWPLARDYPRVLRGPRSQLRRVVFDPGGEWVAATTRQDGLWLWPLTPGDGRGTLLAAPLEAALLSVAASPDGGLLAAGAQGEVRLVPAGGGEVRRLTVGTDWVNDVVFDSSGRRLAAAIGWQDPQVAIRIWDLERGTEQVLRPGEGGVASALAFTAEGRLLSAGAKGVERWDLAAGTAEPLLGGAWGDMSVHPDGRRALLLDWTEGAVLRGRVHLAELESGVSRPLAAHGSEVSAAAWTPTGDGVITGDLDGTLRVGPASGGEPHLLYGHEGGIQGLAVSPDGRWVASAGEDGTLRLWPMPEGPPLHTLPLTELLERLRSLTNYRVVADPEAPSGFRLELAPAPGWAAEPPSW